MISTIKYDDNYCEMTQLKARIFRSQYLSCFPIVGLHHPIKPLSSQAISLKNRDSLQRSGTEQLKNANKPENGHFTRDGVPQVFDFLGVHAGKGVNFYHSPSRGPTSV